MSRYPLSRFRANALVFFMGLAMATARPGELKVDLTFLPHQGFADGELVGQSVAGFSWTGDQNTFLVNTEDDGSVVFDSGTPVYRAAGFRRLDPSHSYTLATAFHITAGTFEHSGDPALFGLVQLVDTEQPENRVFIALQQLPGKDTFALNIFGSAEAAESFSRSSDTLRGRALGLEANRAGNGYRANKSARLEMILELNFDEATGSWDITGTLNNLDRGTVLETTTQRGWKADSGFFTHAKLLQLSTGNLAKLGDKGASKVHFDRLSAFAADPAFSVSKRYLQASGTVTLSWNAPGATSVNISPSVGAVSNSGEVGIEVSESTVFTLNASFPWGDFESEVPVLFPDDWPPNVVFIAVDDLKPILGFMAGDTGNFLPRVYPDPQMREKISALMTPNLDRLAASGVAFNRAYCPVTVCAPSRNAIMTGMRVTQSRLYSNRESIIRAPIHPYAVVNTTTLSQHFKDHQYITAGTGKIFHSWGDAHADKENSWNAWIQPAPVNAPSSQVRSKWAPHYGHFANMGDPSIDPATHNQRFASDDMDWGYTTGGIIGHQDYDRADYIASVIERGIVTANRQTVDITQGPFFLGCGIFRPHLPFYAPEELVDLFDIQDMTVTRELMDEFRAEADNLNAEGSRKLQETLARGLELQPEDGDIRAFKDMLKHYFASVAMADRAVKRLIDALDNSPYADSTIVVLWSDHGWFLGEKFRASKTTLWDKAAHTVLIVRDPRPGMHAKGEISHATVNLQGLYRTLSNLAGLDVPAHVEGYDISRLIQDPHTEWNIPALTTQPNARIRDHAIRHGEWAFMRHNNQVNHPQSGLYHTPSDPHELNNLINDPQYTDVRDELNRLMDKVLRGDSFD